MHRRYKQVLNALTAAVMVYFRSFPTSSSQVVQVVRSFQLHYHIPVLFQSICKTSMCVVGLLDVSIIFSALSVLKSLEFEGADYSKKGGFITFP